ncbi:MAG: dihydroxyacetone kinase operon transcriptional regulator DhaR [Candidatus Promineifilaceae bacterium]
MQPIAYPVQHEKLLHIWQTFVENKKIVQDDSGLLPDPVVIQSWQRCSAILDPFKRPRSHTITEPALSSLLRSQADLISVAMPHIEDLHQFMEGSGAAILLTDGAGCVLALGGDASSQKVVTAYGLGVGTYWSEGYIGTNGVGVALVAAMPVQIVGAEHYCQPFHHLTSSAAPIHDANGRIVGLIGVVCGKEKASAHTLSMVMAIARAISNQFQANMYLEEANHRLTEVNTILETISEGVIAWNANGRIIHMNAQAGNMLKMSPESVLGKSLVDTFQFPPQIARAVAQKRELWDEEVVLTVNNHDTVSVMISLRPLGFNETGPTGFIALLRPIEHVRRIIHQQVGTQAMLRLEDVYSSSPAMRAVVRQAQIAARGTAPVLLRGEGGVGKNHLARAIHNAGTRADKPYLSINCRALPRELMLSELLGYAQEGDRNGRPSKFELVNGGTLFIDRIESMSLEMQTALLQVIETGHVMRLGSSHPIPVDVRIIAATTEDLETAVAEGAFISHLYYRFGVFNIAIPPLRNRVDDIPQLAERFLTRAEGSICRIDDEAMRVLCRYPWPGNVRELEMVLERALHMVKGEVIRVVDLPEYVRNGRVVAGNSPQPAPVLSTEEAEREAIIRAGQACNGRVTEMARQLGIGRTTLWRKMKRYQLSPDLFKYPN